MISKRRMSQLTVTLIILQTVFTSVSAANLDVPVTSVRDRDDLGSFRQEDFPSRELAYDRSTGLFEPVPSSRELELERYEQAAKDRDRERDRLFEMENERCVYSVSFTAFTEIPE